MDGFELNKFMGAITGSLVVFLSIGWLADTLFYTGGHYGGEKPLYASIVEDAGGEDEQKDEPAIDMAVFIAAATVDDGAGVFKKRCSSCHKADQGAAHGQGPALYGVMGRAIASAGGYTKYSDVLKGKGADWGWDNMNAFLTAPKTWAPKTRMNFRGLKKPEDRAAVMAYLNAQSDAPLAAPAPAAPAE